MAVHALVLRVDLRVPTSQSLKQKRQALRPVIDGLRSRFEVSVAETDHQDAWQRAELGVAVVSGYPDTVEQAADQIERFIWQAADIEILSIDRHWTETD